MNSFFLLILMFLVVPAGAKSRQPCDDHASLIQAVRGMKTKDSVCAGQIDHVASVIEKGYSLCQLRNGMEVRPLACSPRNKKSSALREVGTQTYEEAARSLDAADLNTQYQGIADSLIDKKSNCLNRMPSLKKRLACTLPFELGQKAREQSAWNKFWNREKSKAPFADSISPEVRMLGTTVASAALWRGVRGGGWNPDPADSMSTQRRGFTALGYTALGWANGGEDGAIAGALMTPGLFLPYGNFMKKVQGNDKWKNLTIMTGIGAATTALPAAYLYARGYNPLPMLAGGAAKGLCYFGSYQWAPNAFSNSPDKAFVGGVPTQTAELCNGATIGAGLSGSLLYSNNEPPDRENSAALCEPKK